MLTPPPPEAVLFDFDGVLVDSANIHVAAWERAFRLMGWEVPPARCAPAAEVDDRRFLADILAEEGIADADLAGWIARKQAIAGPLFADGAAHPHRGTVALVRALRDRGLRLAIVSGSWRENILAALDACDLADAFECVVAKQDAAPKPDPEPYARALGRLGVDPARAVALEDSPSGIASARAAGLRVVAVAHGREPGDWAGGAPVLASFEPLAAALAALGLHAETGNTPHAR